MSLKKGLNKIKGWFPADPMLNANNRQPKPFLPNKPSSFRERLVGGLGAVGVGFTLLGGFFYFVPFYPKQVVAVLLIAGVPLLVAAFLVWRTYKH
ncbi:MAG: hypothetical protein NWE92_00245 [Candidatus Bathyarchaeota archaeon]|nr:hypothetical protein [Candidatus Bathyarchaeota archaeon]